MFYSLLVKLGLLLKVVRVSLDFFFLFQVLASLLRLNDIEGVELTSLGNPNDKYLKERDAGRNKVQRILSKLEAKHQADLFSARASAMDEYKSSEAYKTMRYDLYSVGIDEAIRLLGLKIPNLDTSDLNDKSEFVEEELPKKEAETRQ